MMIAASSAAFTRANAGAAGNQTLARANAIEAGETLTPNMKR